MSRCKNNTNSSKTHPSPAHNSADKSASVRHRDRSAAMKPPPAASASVPTFMAMAIDQRQQSSMPGLMHQSSGDSYFATLQGDAPASFSLQSASVPHQERKLHSQDGFLESNLIMDKLLLDDRKVPKPAPSPLPEPKVSKPAPYLPPGWKFGSVNVKPLPVFHQLEKHHSRFPLSKLEPVLGGLQDIFRADSLIVHYTDGSGSSSDTVSARCENLEGVKFVLQIWLSSSDECVVEIQRTGGDPMLFCQHRFAKRMLDVVRSHSTPPPTDQTTWPPPIKACTSDPLQYSPEDAKVQQEQLDSMMKYCKVPLSAESEVESAIAIVASMLGSSRFDQVALGLESLATMTDPHKSGCTIAEKAARAVLVGSGNTPSTPPVAALPSTVAFLALSGSPLPSMHPADADLAKYHAFAALNIVAQSVNVLDTSSIQVFATRVVDQQHLKLVEPLLSGVTNANTSPHVAYLSAHILAALCRALPGVREQIRGHLPIVEHAKTVGTCSHAALAQASNRLLQELSVSASTTSSMAV